MNASRLAEGLISISAVAFTFLNSSQIAWAPWGSYPSAAKLSAYLFDKPGNLNETKSDLLLGATLYRSLFIVGASDSEVPTIVIGSDWASAIATIYIHKFTFSYTSLVCGI